MQLSRRQFTALSLAGAAAAVPAALGFAAPSPAKAKNQYCAFIKFLRALKYDELAEKIAALGFGGVEATIRTKDGYLHPKDAAEELPRFKKALEKQGLELTIATTDILSADQEYAESTLRAAVDVGVQRYRLGFFRYETKKPIVEQVEAFRAKLDGLAALNRKVGIAGVYQNHSGADMFGATIWDLFYAIREHSPDELGCVYDLGHATIEAGRSWPTLYSVMKPHITAYSVKDFKWDGPKVQPARLGEGVVDPEFYKTLTQSDYKGPISLHIEYVDDAKDADAQLAAMKHDFATLRNWMEG